MNGMSVPSLVVLPDALIVESLRKYDKPLAKMFPT